MGGKKAEPQATLRKDGCRLTRVHYTSNARLDVDDIAEEIAAHNIDSAIKFCLAVEDALEKLKAMPGMGQRREFAAESGLNLMRSWAVKGFANYIIFYRPADYGIEVVRILHGARDLDSIFSQP